MVFLRSVRAGALAIVMCSVPAMAHAETLREALTSAYLNNPTILSSLLNVKATAENIALAKSAQRPTIGASASVTQNFVPGSPLPMPTGTVGASINQTIFDNFKSDADIEAARALTEASRYALQNAEQLAWTGVAKSIDTPFPAAPLVLGPVSVAWNRVFVFFVALILIGATYLLINRTKLGRAMRATFQDRDTAALMGVRIGNIHTATFALGVLALFVLSQTVPQVAQRIERTRSAVTLSEEGVDHALAGRARIWGAAECMIESHPVNGVGPRDFRSRRGHFPPPNAYLGFFGAKLSSPRPTFTLRSA